MLLFSNCLKKQDITVVGAGEPLFTLSGQVLDRDNDRPITDAVVCIKALNLIDTVDSSGYYHFKDLKVGFRKLDVIATNYEPKQVLVELLDYENRDVVCDIRIIKLAIISWAKDLPLVYASGIWYENSHIFITDWDEKGGSIYKLDENLGFLKASNYLVKWSDDSCRVDYRYKPCHHRLSGLLCIGNYFYSTSGGSFLSNRTPIPTDSHFLYRINHDTLNLVSTFEINGFNSEEVLKLNDMAWDGQSVWMSAPLNNTFVKLWRSNFVLQSIQPSPVEKPEGITWDDHHLWVSSSDLIYQLNVDRTIRNRYRVMNYEIYYMTWDGENILAITGPYPRIIKLTFPFEDHL